MHKPVLFFLASKASGGDVIGIMTEPNSAPGDSDADNRTDCFAPPAEPCECYCLHCNRVFMSDGIWFQKVINARDGFEGFWMCPTPNCDGAGFTFDIFPTDPDHPANQGWTTGEEDDEADAFFQAGETLDTAGEEYDPAETKYAELDDVYPDEDDDLEGEEWKHGLEPGQRPPEPLWAASARREWEEQQKEYDSPDQRPRVVDWADHPESQMPPYIGPEDPGGEIGDSDIPF